MRGKNQNGFTIIEITIFVAVSGLLFVGVLTSTGVAIARQRYSDSVRSTESYLQQQADKTFNFTNDRDGAQTCAGGTITSAAPGTQPAGTSTCYVLGKALRLTQDSPTIKVYNIIGTEPASIISNGAYASTGSDTAVVTSYAPRVVMSVGTETFDVPWDAHVVGASQDQTGVPPATPINTILFLRSPRSGGLLVYTANFNWSAPMAGGTIPLGGAISTSTLQKQARFFIQSQDFTAASSVAEINLTGQGGQSAVEAQFDGVDTSKKLIIP